MKKPVRKKTRNKPLWFYNYNGERYPVTAQATLDLFDILHDEVLKNIKKSKFSHCQFPL